MQQVQLVMYLLQLFEQGRSYCSSSQLCDNCLLTVGKATIEDTEVVSSLSLSGRSFCTCLTYTVIDQNMQQTISNAQNDAEALLHIRHVSLLLFHCFNKYFIFNTCSYLFSLIELGNSVFLTLTLWDSGASISNIGENFFDKFYLVRWYCGKTGSHFTYISIWRPKCKVGLNL